MQETQKPPSLIHQVAHVAALSSFTAAGTSMAGAIVTAEAAGPVHAVFAVGTVGSLVAMAAALAVHGSGWVRCRRCEYRIGRVLSDAAPASTPVPVEQTVPEFAEPMATQPWWAA